MTLSDFDKYIRSFLDLEEVEKADPSLNGLQVSCGRETIQKVAFAVDACMESFKRSADWDADIIFVHHGLFWGKEQRIQGLHYRRIRYLIEADMALFAAHLPLDMHPEYGNNAGIAKLLGLGDIESFGEFRGVNIGFKGRLPRPMQLEEINEKLFGSPSQAMGKLAFGKKTIESIGIVSGGAPEDVDQAIEQNLDLYITGDASHTIYHRCLESGINVIFGGHYNTEIWGVKQLSEKVASDTEIETNFIDVPTGY
jgi:dinuclear metal center YbgI/SA1388 family protein